ncbi:M48 family metallopeptidase [Pseudomarimonas salicorniae]|uniref:M48 family metallopeptidase n=1 Tax=Pseudomarimonas salicorniae TaxID=2933270 RepID=A0ABT0GDG6_9GAMM|nr:M48 family metallopeptidase [Lysobacter sp. CAU 1642]MCK7592576.1 M48 family metallopeptidase [Lysobacter sp. CAU 1642]
MRVLCLLILLAAPQLCAAESKLYLVSGLAEVAPEPTLRAQSTELQAMFDSMAKASGVDAVLLYADSEDINAFATEVEDTKLVVVNRGLLELLAEDRDAVAAVVGHELAHHKADHVRAGQRKQRGVKALGALLGAVVGAKLGRKHGQLAGAVGGAAVGVGATLVALKFNRSQEMEADRLSVQWMADRGYAPAGMLRLQRTLGDLAGKRRAGIFDSHPSSEKRFRAAESQIAVLGVEAGAAPAPLAGGEAIARAEAAIRGEREAALTKALTPAEGGELDPAVLDPVEGVGFEAFAALSNRLVREGRDGRADVLQAHRLDEAGYQRVRDTYVERMREHPALAARYSPAYLRASEGPLAAHARDVADSTEKGRPLALDPPYPIETATALLAAVARHGALRLEGEALEAFEAETLAPHGLSLYDFLIGHAWWMRKARIDAALGDTRTLRLMAAAQAPPAASAAGVRMGEGVRVGKGVKIGGQEVEADD